MHLSIYVSVLTHHVCVHACMCVCMCVCARARVCVYTCMSTCLFLCAGEDIHQKINFKQLDQYSILSYFLPIWKLLWSFFMEFAAIPVFTGCDTSRPGLQEHSSGWHWSAEDSRFWSSKEYWGVHVFNEGQIAYSLDGSWDLRVWNLHWEIRCVSYCCLYW